MKNQPIKIHDDLMGPQSIIHNFDLSIVMPFYKKINEFRSVLPHNAQFFQRNGIEVILSMDESSQEEELINLIKEYSLINWRIVVNRTKHSWRNPAKAINVGIKHATKQFIMVCSPESEFLTDAIFQMRKTLEYYPTHFVIGTVVFTFEKEDVNRSPYYLPYGSIMVRKKDFFVVKGYDESLITWGGDDDNIRARLELSGIKKMLMPEVKLAHREHNENELLKRAEKRNQIAFDKEIDIFYPSNIIANGDKWGTDFDEVIYDWRHNKYSYELIMRYLATFKNFEIVEKEVFLKEYTSIVLVQSYNNADMITIFLEDMARYFEGIILLDDDSEDGTYELAANKKLLLKVKKKRNGFLDIENRNIKLDLASFLSSEWFCFMDTDELFDIRFTKFHEAMESDADVISFCFVNLWNNEQTYNSEYPYSENGVMEKLKMFRNIGHVQIYTKKVKTHFSVIPYQKKIFRSNILYKHFGMISKEKRLEKYQFYKREDIAGDQQSYDHILIENPKLLYVRDLCEMNGRIFNLNIQ